MELKEQVWSHDVFRTPWKEKRAHSTGTNISSQEGQKSDLPGLKPWKQRSEVAQWQTSSASKLGGGIQERIRALQSAPGTSELDFTPVKETSKKTAQASPEPVEKNVVKCEILFGSCGSSEVSSPGGFGESSGSLSKEGLCNFQARQKKNTGVAFEIDVGGNRKKQYPHCVPGRLKDKYLNKKDKSSHLQRNSDEANARESSPTKEERAGTKMTSAPKKPPKRKGEFEVKLYLPKTPELKKVKHDSTQSKNEIVPDLKPSFELGDSDEKCVPQPSSPTKGVAFEINFDGERSQQHVNETRLKRTPFKLKGQAGRGPARTRTSRASQKAVVDKVCKPQNIVTACDGSADNLSGDVARREHESIPVSLKPISKKCSGLHSESVQEAKTPFHSEQSSSKPCVSHTGTLELKKVSPVFESVIKQESDGHDRLAPEWSSDVRDSCVGSKSQATKTGIGPETVEHQDNTAEQAAQDCEKRENSLPTKSSVANKRNTLIRSGTYDKEDVEGVLQSMSGEPSVTAESSEQTSSVSKDSQAGTEPSDGDLDSGDSDETYSVSSSDGSCSLGDDDVERLENCGGSLNLTCSNCGLANQNCNCFPDVISNPNRDCQACGEIPEKPCPKGQSAIVELTCQDSYAVEVQQGARNVVVPVQPFTATELSTALTVPQNETPTKELGKTAGLGAESVPHDSGNEAGSSKSEHPRVCGDALAATVMLESFAASDEHEPISKDQGHDLPLPGSRGTYDLDETLAARSSERNVVEMLDELATSVEMTLSESGWFHCGSQGSSELEPVGDTLGKQGNTVEMMEETDNQRLDSSVLDKRGTYDLEEVSNTLDQSFEVDVNALLDELASFEESWDDEKVAGRSSPEKLQSCTPEVVACTRDEKQSGGDAFLNALDVLASSVDILASEMEEGLTTPRSRGTYTLDQVSQTLEEANTEGKTFEEAFEDALENVEAFEPEGADASESEKRGTYTLDGVASVLDKADQSGTTVVEALGGIAEKYRSLADELDCVVEVIQTQASPRSSTVVVFGPSAPHSSMDDMGTRQLVGSSERRGTYTLDEVSFALQKVNSEGIPVVQALENFTKDPEAANFTLCGETAMNPGSQEQPRDSLLREKDAPGVAGRGTYSLEDVADDLEAAQKRGLPLIDALASLAGKREAAEAADTSTNRGTYTLDQVSDSLEEAKERGLPIVELLDRLAASSGEVTHRQQDAVHRRQQNLTNRKTYALARPLETIGEDSNLTLFDGTTRRVVSPGALGKMRDENAGADKATSVKGLVNTLDFLTSACEVLLSTTAKKAATGSDETDSHPDGTGGPTAVVDDSASATDRKTYTLEDVALTLEGAKEAGLPIVDALKKLSTAQSAGARGALFTNLTRCASKSDSALAAARASENPDRHTYSMDDMSQVLENATSSGLSVIQALDQLTKDLARFRAAHQDTRPREVKSPRKSFLTSSKIRTARMAGRSVFSSGSQTRERCFLPPFHKAYSLDSVLSSPDESRALGMRRFEVLETNTEMLCSTGQKSRSASSLSSTQASDVIPGEARRGTYTLETVSAALESADKEGLPIIEALEKLSVSNTDSSEAGGEDGAMVGSSEENRRTLTLDRAADSLDKAVAQGLPVVGALDNLTQGQEMSQSDGGYEPAAELREFSDSANSRVVPLVAATRQNPAPKPWKKKTAAKNGPSKQQLSKSSALELEADPFFVEIFTNVGREVPEPTSRASDDVSQRSDENLSDESRSSCNTPQTDYVTGDRGAGEATQTNAATTIDCSRTNDHSESCNVSEDSSVTRPRSASASKTLGPRPRAVWRASGSVLDKICSLLDSAEESGLSPADALKRASDLCSQEGEIEEGDDDAQDESQAVTSQMTLLRMQLEEKRRHIEAEKRRSQEQWEEHRRQVGHTAFWYMMGKARGTGEELGQGTGNQGQALFPHDPPSSLNTKQPHQQTPPISGESRTHSNRAADTNTAEEQRSPPIARSSPVGSPVAWQHAAPAPEQEYETREFRLSNFPPNGSVSGDASTPRQTARKCWGVAPTTPTSVAPFYPPESDAQSDASTPAEKGWVIAHPSGEAQTTPPWKGVAENQVPFTPPQSSELPEDARGSGYSTPFSDEVQGSPVSKGVAWSPAPSTPRRQLSAPSGMITPTGGESLSTPRSPNEAEMTPQRKGVALFFGDESSFGSEIMTPEQQKKKERFLRQRQKKQEEEKARKEEELEKRRRKEAKQQEAIRKMQEEKERAQAEERKAMRSRPTPTREVRPSPTPEGFSTYRGPALPRGLSEEDVSASPGQKSGFADFSGPQCYVKPSGKSNRKLITNAITYVCLSGAVNKDQKDKCLQAIAESGGYHFMVLFKDALKFRGLYSYNPESDQAFKIFGIGPRIISGKMVEDLYKYNSGAKEFTKIFAKTLSISIDGLTIQKACWQSNRPVVQSKTMSNLKRGTPRAGQR